jgi:hypothetical protein
LWRLTLVNILKTTIYPPPPLFFSWFKQYLLF